MEMKPVSVGRIEKEKWDCPDQKKQKNSEKMLLPQLGKIVSQSPSALPPAENMPEAVMGRVAELRKGLETFLMQWAGKKRSLKKIVKKKTAP